MPKSSEILIELDRNDLEFLRDLAEKHNISYFNLRMGKGTSLSFSTLNKISLFSSIGTTESFSIQVFYEGGWGFTIGKKHSREELERAFEKAVKLAKWSSKYAKEKYFILDIYDKEEHFSMPVKKPFNSIGPDEKMAFISDIEKAAYEIPSIVSTRTHFSSSVSEVLVFNNFGRFVRTNGEITFLSFSAVAADGANQQTYTMTHGKPGGFEVCQDAFDIGKKTAQSADELLNSSLLKAGQYDIIMDPLLTGTFVHEAFGHACEADSILSGTSLLKGRIGEKVGSEQVTIIDDGTHPNEFGTIFTDSEGTPAHKTYLVEKGVLKGYLHSLDTASRMQETPTGNGRSQSIGSSPLVRMTNTYLQPGDASLEEMMEEIGTGILAVGWRYGYTDPIDGSFQFKCAKAYLIENGEKTKVLRETAISGMTLDVLNRVSMVGKTLEMDAGFCGKNGQSVRVGSGGPYTLIRNMIMGGQ